MKITDIRQIKLVGPRIHCLGGTRGTIGKVVIRVETDSGLYGLGEAENFLGVGDAVDYVKTGILGRDPLEITPIVSEMLYGTLPPHTITQRREQVDEPLGGTRDLSSSPTATPSGPIVWGMSGIEMALCDLAGKALKTPVYNLLGGKFREQVRVYLDRSSPEKVQDLDEWKKMGEDAVKEGFRFLKFDIDHTAPDHTGDVWNRSLATRQIDAIVQRISAVREAVGNNAEIAVDGHRLYNIPDALRLAAALEPLRLFWFEDPTPLVNPDACAAVRTKSAIPICVGEMFTAEEFRTFIDHDACDIVHPDVLFCGGMHELLRISQYAELNYLPTAMHGNGSSLAAIAAAHVAAAARNFIGLEFHFIETDWIVQLVEREGAPLFEDGYIRLTDAPGLGVELNEEVCREYVVEER